MNEISSIPHPKDKEKKGKEKKRKEKKRKEKKRKEKKRMAFLTTSIETMTNSMFSSTSNPFEYGMVNLISSEIVEKKTLRQVDIFVPCIKPTILSEDMKKMFHTMNIGKITSIDMHCKVNANRRKYAFAFITVELYDTEAGTQLYENTLDQKCYRLMYDSPLYWEVKSYIPYESRCSSNITAEFESIYRLCKTLMRNKPHE